MFMDKNLVTWKLMKIYLMLQQQQNYRKHTAKLKWRIPIEIYFFSTQIITVSISVESKQLFVLFNNIFRPEEFFTRQKYDQFVKGKMFDCFLGYAGLVNHTICTSNWAIKHNFNGLSMNLNCSLLPFDVIWCAVKNQKRKKKIIIKHKNSCKTLHLSARSIYAVRMFMF